MASLNDWDWFFSTKRVNSADEIWRHPTTRLIAPDPYKRTVKRSNPPVLLLLISVCLIVGCLFFIQSVPRWRWHTYYPTGRLVSWLLAFAIVWAVVEVLKVLHWIPPLPASPLDTGPVNVARLKRQGYKREIINNKSRPLTVKEKQKMLFDEADKIVKKASGWPAIDEWSNGSNNYREMRSLIINDPHIFRSILNGTLSLVVHNITNDWGRPALSMFFKPIATETFPYGWTFDASVPGYVPRQRDPYESPAPLPVPPLPASDVYGSNDELTDDELLRMGALHPMPQELTSAKALPKARVNGSGSGSPRSDLYGSNDELTDAELQKIGSLHPMPKDHNR